MELPNHIPINPFGSNDNTISSGGLGALKTIANNTINYETNEIDKNSENSVVQNLINKSKRKKRTSVSMTHNSYKKIVTLAMANDISVSSVVELIIEEAVKDVPVNDDLVEMVDKKENKKKNKIKKAKKNKSKTDNTEDSTEED